MLHPRARTMLLLSIPAILIGIASSLVLIVAMKIAAILQSILWSDLPAHVGIAADSPLWIIAILTLTGIAVGLVVRFSPGHGGPDPATESLIGAPIATNALPGLLAALILGLAGGVSLGPEHPIMVVRRPRFAPVSTGKFAGLDNSRRVGNHRRAVRHAGCRRAYFFANAQ